MAAEDYVDALQAALDLRSPSGRAALVAEVHWTAGAPFTALETLVEAPGDLEGSPRALRLVANLAASVGAGRLGGAAASALQATVAAQTNEGTLPSPEWWRGEAERVQSAAQKGSAASAAVAASISRARLATGLVLTLALLVLGGLLRERRPSISADSGM